MRYITAFWYNEHRENFVNSLKFTKLEKCKMKLFLT